MTTRTLLKAAAVCALVAFAGCRTVPPPVYMINASAKTPEAQRLADGVALDLRGTLVKGGYPVVFAEPANPYTAVIGIDLLFDRRETAALDVWRTYEGTADARVSSVGGTARREMDEEVLVAERAFKVAGTRADNELDAEASVREGLSAQLGAWLSAELEVTRPPAK